MRIINGDLIYESFMVVVEQVYENESLNDWYYQFFISDESTHESTTYWFENPELRKNRTKVDEILRNLKINGYLDLDECGLVWDKKEVLK